VISTNKEHSQLLSNLNLSPEERLLVLCARLNLNEEQRAELNALVSASPDWEELMNRVQWQMSIMVFHHLRTLDRPELVPARVMDWFKSSYLSNVGRNLFFQAELRKVLETLTAAGIPAIPLKGSVLAPTVYRDIGLRPMSDLDILVPHQDADRADAVVRELGYRPGVDQQTQEEMRQSDRQLAALIGVGKPVIVEIHPHITEVDNPLRFDISGFWERARPLRIAGVDSLTLSPEDFLTHLAVNFFKDRHFYGFSALGQLCDISEMIKLHLEELDWTGLVREGEAAGLVGPLFCALYLARHLLEAPIPDQVLEELEPAGFNPREALRMVRLRVLGDQWVAKALVAPGHAYHWWTIPIIMLRRVFPSPRYLVERYRGPGQTPVRSREIFGLYWRSVKDALSIARRSLRQPRAMREDLAVDRWLHSLYGDQKNGKARKRANAQ
jgi:hypothetical protein